jgi:hypothetical protein
MNIIKRFLSKKPVMSQEEKIRLIKLWVTVFELRSIRHIAGIQVSSSSNARLGEPVFFCRLEGKEFKARTTHYKEEAPAVDEALRLVRDMVETEVTQMLGKTLT